MAKLGVVVEEVDECVLWIEMLIDAEILKKARLDQLLNEARQLTAIFTASRETAKQEVKLPDYPIMAILAILWR